METGVAPSRVRTRTARLDLRLSPANRDMIARAAQANDTTLVDYVLGVVIPAARRDLAQAHTTYLSREAWNDFVTMLDEPDTPAMAALRQRSTRWDAAE